MYLLCVWFLFGIFGISCENKREWVKVNTSLGEIIGMQDGNLNTFLGIPYAEPPVGQYRFEPSIQKKRWAPRSVQALKFSPECIQSESFTIIGSIMSEDCLYLNIWQPTDKNNKNSKLPVMVWIYGGGFLHGAASRLEYIGNRLAARGIVVVSFNYRVGALGFLVSTSDGLFGNYGLHDQKLALQWVQDHIANFGGDPTRVTLFGEASLNHTHSHNL